MYKIVHLNTFLNSHKAYKFTLCAPNTIAKIAVTPSLCVLHITCVEREAVGGTQQTRPSTGVGGGKTGHCA